MADGLKDTERSALERVRVIAVTPPTVARHDDLRLLLALLDRMIAEPRDLSPRTGLASVTASLRAVLDSDLDAPAAIRQRLVGALLILDLLAADEVSI